MNVQLVAYAPPMPQPLRVKKILVPIDFSGPSEKAFTYAIRFAQQFGSEIILIHVLESPAESKDGAELVRVEEKLQSLADSSPRTGNLYIHSTVRSGVATHAIIEAATQLDCDLIITATHGVAGWKQTGMGSTATRVAHAAPCPVLIIRANQREFI
jgi:nucleotide-binding universal stress UspA family protein